MYPLGESNSTGNGKGKRWVTTNALALGFALALISALYLGADLPQGMGLAGMERSMRA